MPSDQTLYLVWVVGSSSCVAMIVPPLPSARAELIPPYQDQDLGRPGDCSCGRRRLRPPSGVPRLFRHYCMHPLIPDDNPQLSRCKGIPLQCTAVSLCTTWEPSKPSRNASRPRSLTTAPSCCTPAASWSRERRWARTFLKLNMPSRARIPTHSVTCSRVRCP